MPARGGAAGKFGDRYEALWTVDVALRIISGHAEFVTYESLDPEASRGVEFNVQTTGQEVEFWSLKRQTTAATGWTLAALVKADEQGRSILGDLVGHVERDGRNIAVFASTLGAPKLEELRAASATPQLLSQRLDQSQELKGDYTRYLLPLFGGDDTRAHQFLARLQIRTADERSLQTQLESTISLLFYDEKAGTLDTSAVRRSVAEYLLEHMHERIDRRLLLENLAAQGIRRKDWKIDATVREKVTAHCEAYIRPLREQLIGGTLQQLPGVEKLLGTNGLPLARRTLISAAAGGGKSSASANIVERLRGTGVPVLAVRMDAINESVLTPQRLGEELSLPASPVAVLAGLADGAECVLVIDQLDAVSLASGRRVEVWSLFEQILAETEGYPNLYVIVACREFDLEHDHRMRRLKGQSTGFELVKIGAFEPDTLDVILGARKVHPKLKPLLAVPLHLAMFLHLEQSQSERLETRDELFGAFWIAKHRQTSQRLGRNCDFAGVVDRLARRLSENQQLSAPAHFLDDVRGDADALTSEHVLVLAEGRYRFFHEAFFDYAFARRFAQSGERLLNLLLSSTQHLFRRAQVRQILSFLRSSEAARYVTELESVLADDRVRFHIKRVVLQFLTALDQPSQHEWRVLRDLGTARRELRGHVISVISNHVGWFDALHAADFFNAGLSSSDVEKEEQVIVLCARPEILTKRSALVAAILAKHRNTSDEKWQRYLQHVCRSGNVFHGREFFDLFLSLIHDGTLDGVRPAVALNDNWWSTLWSLAQESPAMACEAIGAWFDRRLTRWCEAQSEPLDASVQSTPPDKKVTDSSSVLERGATFRSELAADGDDHGVISTAAKACRPFVEQVLPRIAAFIAKHVEPHRRDGLDIDPLWSLLSFGDNARYQTHDSLFKSLARAVEGLARYEPSALDPLLGPYLNRPHQAIAYLILRAWTAAPNTYAEQLAHYLADDPRRLRIGYASWGAGSSGPGVAVAYRSIQAIRAASATCSVDAFAALEDAILGFRDVGESRHPSARGLSQLQLLTALNETRLTPRGRSRLAELRAKFPNVTHEPPKAMEIVQIVSPIPDKAQEKMTDRQWLSAMTAYAGVDHRHDRKFETSGGERQLAQALQANTKTAPARFAALSAEMPMTLPSGYFEAIIRGVAETPAPGSDLATVELSVVVDLVHKAHALEKRPCGQAIAQLVERWGKVGWPRSVVEIVAWYAMNDPDPAEELWRKSASNGQLFYGGDLDLAGINSTRGSAANAIARLLFDTRENWADVLVQAAEHLARDTSLAVRAQAVYPLLALLNTQSDLAIRLFIECVSIDPILLRARWVQHFVYHAGSIDYGAVRAVIQAMLASDDAELVAEAANLCCLLALDVDEAKPDAEQVRTGSPTMRAAAARTYAAKIAHREFGMVCREQLLPFFSDPDDSVRANAASAFHRVSDLDLLEQGKLLQAFLDAAPNAAALEPVIRAMEDSPVQLPSLVCRLVEQALVAFKTGVDDIRTHTAMIAVDLSKIVIRLYTQSDDETMRVRCLDAIDTMELSNFLGLSDELGRMDR